MELVTFIIAVCGFLLSLTTWIKDIVSQRQNISVSISQASSYNSVTYFFMHFANHSRLPVAITQIVLKNNGHSVNAVSIPTFIFGETNRVSGNEISSWRLYSLQLPICIPGLGAESGYILFAEPEAFLPEQSTQVTLAVSTNRRRAIEMTLPICLEPRP